MALELRGYQVSVAATCAEAVAAKKSETFDVLISDVNLPDGSGIDLLHTLRDGARLPAVALSGMEDDDGLRRAGFEARLVKPVAIEELVAAIESLPV